jgi:hypothetical protein
MGSLTFRPTPQVDPPATVLTSHGVALTSEIAWRVRG